MSKRRTSVCSMMNLRRRWNAASAWTWTFMGGGWAKLPRTRKFLNPSHHTTFLNMKDRKRGSNWIKLCAHTFTQRSLKENNEFVWLRTLTILFSNRSFNSQKQLENDMSADWHHWSWHASATFSMGDFKWLCLSWPFGSHSPTLTKGTANFSCWP